MSRIRGIEVKVQKEVLQTRKYGLNEILKQKAEEDASDTKDDIEKNQISELVAKLPALDAIFQVHRKIGEGTFSSVYLGSLRRHASLPPAARRWFAIKHLVPTAHPARVQHELRCLMDMGGEHNVIGVDLCLRHLDTIVFVMPYIPHRKFSLKPMTPTSFEISNQVSRPEPIEDVLKVEEYVEEMGACEVRDYMRALLAALAHVHSFGVIHRDVKPSNFLYDRENQRYLLVDFGLAQRLCAEPAPAAATRKRAREEDLESPAAKRAALDLSVSRRVRAAPPPPPAARAAAFAAHRADLTTNKSSGGGASVEESCACAGRGALCAACLARPAARAPRAGTQGYRPPEVLLKVAAQGVGVDVWAAGVVLGAALTGRYPLLRAPDDAAALAELADLLGSDALDVAAAAMGRRVVTSSRRRGVCLRRLTARLRGAAPPAPPRPAPCPHCMMPAFQCVCRGDEDPTQWQPGVRVAGFPDAAFALLARLLQPDPARRPSAEEALRHPFLTEPPLQGL